MNILKIHISFVIPKTNFVFFSLKMFNVNEYTIYRAISSLEREVNNLKTSNTTLVNNNNHYTKEEIDDKFVINDYENTLSFTDGSMKSKNAYWSICYENGMYVTVGYYGNASYATCAWSTDGKYFTDGTFTKYETPGLDKSGICYGNGIFVAVGHYVCAWSTDGKTFTEGTTNEHSYLRDICYGKDMFVAVGNNECAWSNDGKTFTITQNQGVEYSGVCYGKDMFVAVGNNVCGWSNDGKTFIDISFEGNWYGICYGSDKFVTVGLFGITKYAESKSITAKSFALKYQTYTKTECDEKFAPKEQSHTITHLCPVDESEDINSFVIGNPVYMTGNVYVKRNNTWNKSISTDSIDCISSVKTTGTWREYLGICTHILPKGKENNQSNINENHDENEILSRSCGEIKFASHGDYMIKVSNSSEFKVGDIIYLNENNEGKLEFKVLTGDVVLTAKINKLIVGTVTGIIDETTLSLFKE